MHNMYCKVVTKGLQIHYIMQLIQFHHHFNTSKVHMHQLQWISDKMVCSRALAQPLSCWIHFYKG